MRFLSTALLLALAAIPVLAQPVNPGVVQDAFHVNVLLAPTFAGLPQGTVDLTNAGVLGADPTNPGIGNICVNVYTFAANRQAVGCCSCLVPPNGLFHLTSSDMGGSAARSVTPNAGFVIKLLATVPGPNSSTPGTNAGPFIFSSCNPSISFSASNLAPGMRAWATRIQTDPVTSATSTVGVTEFSSAPLSPGELATLGATCHTLTCGNPAVCPSCQ